MYTHNNLDTKGAVSDNNANITLSSNLLGGIDIARAWGKAAAYASLVGSGYDYGLIIFGQKVWGEGREVPEYHWEKSFSLSKEKGQSFRVQAGPIPLSVSFRIAGEMGLTFALDVFAIDSDDIEDQRPGGDDGELWDFQTESMQKFPGSERIGLAAASATPYGNLKATASVGVDVLLFRAGVAGELTVIDLKTPLTGYLGWGLTQINPPVLRAGVWADFVLQLSVMSGRIYVYAEHWKVWGCGWSLCSGYNRFWDLTIASWNGWRWNQTLWSSPYYYYDVRF
jgi:hypothetical protein